MSGFPPRKLSTGFPLSTRGGAFSHRGTIASQNTAQFLPKPILEHQEFDTNDSIDSLVANFEQGRIATGGQAGNQMN